MVSNMEAANFPVLMFVPLLPPSLVVEVVVVSRFP